MFQQRATSAQLLAAAGLLGFVLGLCWPAWHVALEPAQLIARIVSYPIATPFQLYETQVWNVWHQLLALPLAAGFAEHTLTLLLSGVVAALAFAACAGFAHALGASPAFALAAPLLVLLQQAAQSGFGYPIYVLGHGHTYGMAGLAWLALASAALASERWRLAGWLVGVAPALHASLGAWLAIAIGLAALPALSSLRPHLRGFLAAAAVGAALSALSLGFHWALTPLQPPSDPASAERYLAAFVRLWDAHRVAPELGSRASFGVWCSTLTALAWLRVDRDRLRAGPALALRVLVACGAIGFASAALQPQLVLASLPQLLLIAMPTRLANLAALLAVPLALAVIYRFRADPLPRALLLGALGLFALRFADPIWWGQVDLRNAGLPLLSLTALLALARQDPRRGTVTLIAAGLAGWLIVRALWRGPANAAWLGFPGELPLIAGLGLMVGGWLALEQRAALQPLRRHARLLDVALGVALASLAVAVLALSVSGTSLRWQQLRDWTNHPVLTQAARGEGLLLVAPGLQTVQLRARRPLPLDPSALDMLPYVLSAGPAVEEILRDAYGVEFFRPPAQALGQGSLPEHPLKATFERRTAAEWRELRVRYGVSEVLTWADWKLQLEALARSEKLPVPGDRLGLSAPARGDGYALYALPE